MPFDRRRFSTSPFVPARAFGRGPVRVLAAAAPAPSQALTLPNDVKLFASTFAAGFLFVTVFLA
ncbi:MAG: hypothetical protein ABIO29_05040 [Sphingomicrobium sp.]